ncbi:MAG: DUF1080 domain-containing protein [Verrucomicrobiales bacterium]|nr:DUF1080 domain-containing protein [Verrucomicrobiales bacterium]
MKTPLLLGLCCWPALAWGDAAAEPAPPGSSAASQNGFVALFQGSKPLEGWVVRNWSDVSQPAEKGTAWKVNAGILSSEGPRGCWLISEKEYGDFILEYEFKLGPTGNSGCALRTPAKGDPAFDGLEMQMADFRYNTKAKDSELTGGFYRAAAPAKQVYKPEEWNRVQIELRGSRARVTINGQKVQDIDLDTFTTTVARHDGTPAPPLKDRPRRGRIGFQELSRDGSHVQIRGVRIKEL